MNQTDNSAFAGMEPNGMHMECVFTLVHTTQTNSFYYVYPQSVVYPPLTKLFVGQIPKTMQTEDVMTLFQHSYPVQSAHIIRDRVTGEHKGGYRFNSFMPRMCIHLRRSEYCRSTH